MERVGFIGLGIMGKPMVENLLKAGYPVDVYDVSEEAVNYLVDRGAKASTPEEMGREDEIIITMLPNGEIVRDTLFNGVVKGLADNPNEHPVVCDMSSVTATDSQQCYRAMKEAGAGFVDAPVSGGEPGAIAGTLAIMCGGDQEDFDALQGVFDAMGSSAILIGPSGGGSVAKLANQVIVNLNIAAVSEAFVLAAKAGVDPMKVYQAIRGGLAGSAVLDAKVPMICRRDFKPGGKISINHKDIKNVLATAHDIDVPMPLTAQLFEIQQALKVAGHMDDDHCGYVQYFEALADCKVQSDEA